MEGNVSYRQKFVWNTLGSLANALSSLILSIIVNRLLGGNYGGLFAFAYSNAQLMITVGLFEVRPYQSTDIDEKYSFSDYLSLRVITCILMVVITLGYVCLNDFGFEKNLVVILLVLFKTVDAFTDVYAGRFQQKDRIDLSGKTFFVRVVMSTVVFIVLAVFTRDVIISSAGLFLTSLALFWIYDCRFIEASDRGLGNLDFIAAFNIARETFPIFVGTFIMGYVGNAPKYAINKLFSDELQNIYNILFMPAFVINMFSIFIFRPLLLKMAQCWVEEKIKEFVKIILSIYGAIVAITIVVLAGTWIIGIPALSFVYGVNLEEYRVHLMFVMLGGGISAIVSFSNNVIVVMRQQKWLFAGYLSVLVICLLFVDKIVKRYAISGAIFSYDFAISAIAFVFMVLIAVIVVKKARRIQGKLTV